MKPLALLTFTYFLAACSGAPFSLVESTSTVEDSSPLPEASASGLAPAEATTSEATAPPLPEAAPPAPEAAATLADAGPAPAAEASLGPSPIEASAPEAGAPEAEATPPEAAAPPPETSVVAEASAAAPLCQPYTVSGPFPKFALEKSELDFGAVPVGTSKLLTDTITNVGTCAFAGSASGGAPGNTEYTMQDDCGPTRTYQPGDTCHLAATFAPSEPGEVDTSTTIDLAGQAFLITFTGEGK